MGNSFVAMKSRFFVPQPAPNLGPLVLSPIISINEQYSVDFAFREGIPVFAVEICQKA